jgi:hypothetical protein
VEEPPADRLGVEAFQFHRAAAFQVAELHVQLADRQGMAHTLTARCPGLAVPTLLRTEEALTGNVKGVDEPL